MSLEPVQSGPNVELRTDAGRGEIVVISFPYDAHLVEAVRRIPGRRFDWDAREWWAPIDDWVGAHVREILERFPELEPTPDAAEWLSVVSERWIGHVTTDAHDGRGWFVAASRAGNLPEEIAELGEERDGHTWLPLTLAVAEAFSDLDGARLDGGAVRCVMALEAGREPARATLTVEHGVAGARLRLDPNWDPAVADAFAKLPEAESRTRTLPIDPWHIEHLDEFCALHGVEIGSAAVPVIDQMRVEHEEARAAIRRSKATSADPIEEVAARLGGELAPFQWAGVRYLLDTRRAFLADEQGLGKTIEALATLEADDAWPAIVVCPASLKLVWEREAAKWLPHRTTQVLVGRGGAVPRADLTIVNYEIVAAHRESLLRVVPKALVLDESHYCKNPRAKRTQEIRRIASRLPPGALCLALSGTPVMNEASEIVSQLRILGRLEEFGSGERFARQFEGGAEERLHWHLRRVCFVRRLKHDVLPQLPDKRRVVVPIELSNTREYRLAEKDVIDWLREQPLDLSELDAKIARVLRAKRLAQLAALKRLAARGKLRAALAWIHDFIQHGEALVVFSHHAEIQQALLERFPEALHLLGRDSAKARDAAITEFQDPNGPNLIICATRVAGQGITLTRASNVAFLELEWTPALHDQAEDRCHRIGQHDAVTAYYLLAADTIDETISRALARKRGIVGAVTDGQRDEGMALVEAVVRELRGEPWQMLRVVQGGGSDEDADAPQ